MNDLMLDIETLGISIPSPIISIAGVFFDIKTGEVGDSFYSVIALESALEYGKIDSRTLQWWFKQSSEARSVFDQKNSFSLEHTLKTFSTFLLEKNTSKNLCVWGNGSCFDNAILANAYDKLGIPLPWNFRNDRDVRTIVDLCIRVKGKDPLSQISREGVHHNALDDALHQIRYVSLSYKLLNG